MNAYEIIIFYSAEDDGYIAGIPRTTRTARRSGRPRRRRLNRSRSRAMPGSTRHAERGARFLGPKARTSL